MGECGSFRAVGFLAENKRAKDVRFPAFDGIETLCPGRHFATSENSDSTGRSGLTDTNPNCLAMTCGWPSDAEKLSRIMDP